MTVMTTYYKAVRPDGTDFYSGLVQWATPGSKRTRARTVKRPTATLAGVDADSRLSVSTSPTDCTGFGWPCRLLTVERVPGQRVTTPEPAVYPNKRAGVVWRVTGERPAHEVFGPQGEQVVALIERSAKLSPTEAEELRAAVDLTAVWYAARGAARDAARAAAWGAGRDAARAAARAAAWYAARETQIGTQLTQLDAWPTGWSLLVRDLISTVVVRDLISTEHYDTLTMPWRNTIGPIHPDDPASLDGAS